MKLLLALLATGCFSTPTRPAEGTGDGGGSGSNDGRPAVDAAPPPCPAAAAIPNLRIYMPFDENTGTVAGDLAAPPHDGSVTGSATWAPGRIGTAIEIDGTGAGVSVGSPSDLDDLSPISLCAWIWREPASFTFLNVADKTANGNMGGWDTYLTYSSPSYRLSFFTNYRWFAYGTFEIQPQVWTHVCSTWDGTNGVTGVRLYVNGQPDPIVQSGASTMLMTPDTDASSDLVLGSSSTLTNYWLAGRIDELLLYQGVLTPLQIDRIFQCAP